MAAYLAFGEIFFDEGLARRSDPVRARRVGVPAGPGAPARSRNPAYGYAWYKLGHTLDRMGDHARALAAFARALEYAARFATVPGAGDLGAAAAHDIVEPYAEAADPREAYAFFHRVSGDAPDEGDKTFAMMEALGQMYLDAHQFEEATILYDDLADRAGQTDLSSAAACEGRVHAREARCALHPGCADLRAP